MTDGQKDYLQEMSNLRSCHRSQIGQAISDVRAMQVHKETIAYLDLLIGPKKRHAAGDEDDRQPVRRSGSELRKAADKEIDTEVAAY